MATDDNGRKTDIIRLSDIVREAPSEEAQAEALLAFLPRYGFLRTSSDDRFLEMVVGSEWFDHSPGQKNLALSVLQDLVVRPENMLVKYGAPSNYGVTPCKNPREVIDRVVELAEQHPKAIVSVEFTDEGVHYTGTLELVHAAYSEERKKPA